MKYINPKRVTVTGQDMVTGVRPLSDFADDLFNLDHDRLHEQRRQDLKESVNVPTKGDTMNSTEHDKTIGFVKHYCTMIRIGNQGRLTPESIALEKLLDALIKRGNRSSKRS